MEIVIKGKQGEGKTCLANSIANRFTHNEKVASAKFIYGKTLKSDLFKHTGRQPYSNKTIGWVVIDGIGKGELKAAKKEVKAVRLTGSKFSVIYVVQQ